MTGTWNPTGRDALDNAPPAERRQCTVLVADLAGFTALSRRTDPEEMVDILAKYFEVVDTEILRQGGRLDKHIGDAVMAVFGAPVAQGDEPSRAVAAALAIHRGLEDLSRTLRHTIACHIGIATGEVLAGRVGSSHLARYTVLGDAANLASRLDGMATAKMTLVSDETRRAVGDNAAFTCHGDFEVKGFETALTVWRLDGSVDPEERDRGPLIGREQELGRIYHQVERHGVAWVTGEPGLGKTRLLRAACLSAHQGGRTAVDLRLPAVVITESDRLQTQLGTGVMGALAGDSEALFQAVLDEAGDHAPAIWDLLLLPPPPKVAGLLEATALALRAVRRSEALTWLLRRLARNGAVVALDDLHHLHPADFDELGGQLNATAGQDVAWLLAGRPLDRQPVLIRTDVESVVLLPLAPDAVQALAVQLAQALPHVSEAHIERSVERARGNPFFLEQLIQSPEGEAVPGSIHSVVLARLDRLESQSKVVLQTASALGASFPEALLEACVEGEADIEALVSDGFFARDGSQLSFTQDLLREGAYASALKTHRKKIHLGAASWYGETHPEQRALHLDHAESPKAASAWLDAARQRYAESRIEHALALVERGIAAADEATSVVALRAFRAELLNELHRPKDALEELQPLLEEEHSPAIRACLMVTKAAANRLLFRVTENQVYIRDEVEPAARAHGTRLELAHCLVLKASAMFLTGETAGMVETLEEARLLAAEEGDLRMELRAESGLGDYHWAAGTFGSGLASFERVVRLAHENNLTSIEVANVVILAILRFMHGDVAQGQADILRGLELAHRVAATRTEIISRGNLAWQLGWMARFEDAERAYLAGREAVTRAEMTGFEAVVDAYYASTLFWRGDRAGALALAKETRPGIERAASSVFLLTLLGIIASCSDDPDERAQALADRVEVEPKAVGMARVCFYSTMIEYALESCSPEEALSWADQLEASFSDEPYALCDLLARRARVLAEDSDSPGHAARLSSLRQAVTESGFHALLRLL